ncbi:hypothetical protein ABMA28_012782 [Loxostege sticticalis]|uniref:Roc domain-containing protein n=1 Tax=Loxostege sticticalis TaxID=481309 RepID=A0ABD0S3M5_LOXSC
MLDVSCNLLRAVPPAIHELSSLSVLNISGNKEITELPPQMGLLSRLWNLNAHGCSLQEPLRSMVRGGRYKSADVVGYLKSVLQEARPYANIKLMLVGLQGIGKTSLLECLRQESAIHHRRKPTDHWAKRMGNKTPRRGNISTVGVDIGTWVYEKHRSTRGPVTFRTWDFGGQQEYYATHQYFLSRRSLYLVVWKATDGRNGLAGAIEWLRSIQARAPGSPVIMVATHYDQVANNHMKPRTSIRAKLHFSLLCRSDSQSILSNVLIDIHHDFFIMPKILRTAFTVQIQQLFVRDQLRYLKKIYIGFSIQKC